MLLLHSESFVNLNAVSLKNDPPLVSNKHLLVTYIHAASLKIDWFQISSYIIRLTEPLLIQQEKEQGLSLSALYL